MSFFFTLTVKAILLLSFITSFRLTPPAQSVGNYQVSDQIFNLSFTKKRCQLILIKNSVLWSKQQRKQYSNLIISDWQMASMAAKALGMPDSSHAA